MVSPMGIFPMFVAEMMLYSYFYPCEICHYIRYSTENEYLYNIQCKMHKQSKNQRRDCWHLEKFNVQQGRVAEMWTFCKSQHGVRQADGGSDDRRMYRPTTRWHLVRVRPITIYHYCYFPSRPSNTHIFPIHNFMVSHQHFYIDFIPTFLPYIPGNIHCLLCPSINAYNNNNNNNKTTTIIGQVSK